MIFNDDFDYLFILGPFGQPFLKVAEHIGGRIRPVVKTFGRQKAPYLTFTCLQRGQELFTKTMEAFTSLSDVASLVAYFAENCHLLSKADLIKLQEICPCVSV